VKTTEGESRRGSGDLGIKGPEEVEALVRGAGPCVAMYQNNALGRESGGSKKGQSWEEVEGSEETGPHGRKGQIWFPEDRG
jgi:hypothetical protein